MRSFRLTYRHDVPAGDVAALLTDADYCREELLASGGKDAEVLESDSSGGVTRIVTRHRHEAELPSFAAKVLPSSAIVTETNEWRQAADAGVHRCAWSVQTKGAPITTSGTLEIVPREGGCEVIHAGDIKVSVPLVGGKVESLLIKNIERDTGLRDDFLRSRLAGS